MTIALEAASQGGVETGGTWCTCVLGTGPDDIVAEHRFRTVGPTETVERIGEFFDSYERPRAIGVGAFGPIDLDTQSTNWGVLGKTPKPGWAGADLGPALSRRVGAPVVLETDVNAAALGECRWGAGRGLANVCYLTVGTGIGVGIVANGALLHGVPHPEAGHMRIPHDWLRDPFGGACPSHGDCWEGLASGQALLERWRNNPAELPDDHPAWALEAEYLSLGITNVIYTASPHRVIVGGGVVTRDGLLQRVRGRVAELLAGYPGSEVLANGLDDYIVGVALAGRAGALGAMALAASSVV